MKRISIKQIKALQILNSRGVPTIEVNAILSDGYVVRTSVPNGASTGIFEAHNLVDGVADIYFGRSVTQAIANINTKIAPFLISNFPITQKEFDDYVISLDGTASKGNLGANAILAMSITLAKIHAYIKEVPLYVHLSELLNTSVNNLPIPLFNILNGGAHADNDIAIQEFMVIPSGIHSYPDQLRAGSEIYHSLKKILKEKELSTAVGDEGGFAPKLKSDVEALKLVVEAITKANYEPGRDVFIGLDVAISQYANNTNPITYNFPHQGVNGDLVLKTPQEIIEYYKELVTQFPIILIEDGLSETDWTNWPRLTSELASKNVLSVGDDLIVTNPLRLAKAVDSTAISGLIVKPNQIGTISETLEVLKKAKEAQLTCVASHRSGETNDNFIVHIAMAGQTKYIKAGATARGERLAKYNELLRIYSDLHPAE